ncbi:Excision repair cross-complementation group 1 [Mitosporidium daphniae]
MSLTISVNQKGNPILKYLVNIPYTFSDISSDYTIGDKSCILYLSLKFHALYPDYIHSRFKENGGLNFTSRYLLCCVDVDDPKFSIVELTEFCVVQDWTIILAWSHQECARYIETFKRYQHKSADRIKEKVKTDNLSRAMQFLTRIKGINNTDAMNLITHFGSINGIAKATREELLQIPGFGLKKVSTILADVIDRLIIYSKH